MKQHNTGFTLIELVIVIVILGILAATVAPRFVSLEVSARQAVVDAGVAAVLSSAAILFASNAAATGLTNIVNNTDGVVTSGAGCGTSVTDVRVTTGACNAGGAADTTITVEHCGAPGAITQTGIIANSFCNL